MTKEEKIKEAYGEYWETLKEFISDNGWISFYDDSNRIRDIFHSQENISVSPNNNNNWRPKSLQGIENNNGWIKIESENDLPKEKGLKCLFLCIHGNTTYISDDVLEDPKWFTNKYSHWRLKNEIKDPIY